MSLFILPISTSNMVRSYPFDFRLIQLHCFYVSQRVLYDFGIIDININLMKNIKYKRLYKPIVLCDAAYYPFTIAKCCKRGRLLAYLDDGAAASFMATKEKPKLTLASAPSTNVPPSNRQSSQVASKGHASLNTKAKSSKPLEEDFSHVDPDELFVKFTISEIKSIQGKLRCVDIFILVWK